MPSELFLRPSRRLRRRVPARLAPLAAAAGLALAGLLAAPLPASAQAPAAAAPSFDIPAGPLDQALVRFAQQAGVTLSMDASRLAGLRTDGLRGSHGVDEGFAQLLRGSGLRAVRSAGGYVLAAAEPASSAPAAAQDAASLATVTVSADAERGAATEGTGSYTTQSTSTSTRLNLSPRETPQSISVITRQRIDDQGLTQLTDVIAQTPGLVVAQGGNTGSDSSPIYSRGFGVDTYLVDGVRQLNSGYTDIFQTYDIATVDRVEVLRGASGLMSGIGTPGAAINVIRKRPVAGFQALVRGELGSWAHRRAEADISTPLNEAGTVRGRLIAAMQKSDSYIDRLEEERKVLYGVVEADLTPDTRVHAGFSWQRMESTGHARGGLPAYYSDGTRTHWRVSDSAAADWASSYRRYGSVFAGIEHQLAPDWKLKATAIRSWTIYDEVLGYASGGNPDRFTGAGVSLWAGRWAADPRQDTLDVQVTGKFDALGRKHDLVFGAEASRATYTTPGYNLWYFDGWSSAIPNIHLWNGAWPAQPYNPANSMLTSDERLYSAYGTLRFRPADSLAVLVGARVTDWRRDQSTTTFRTGRTTYNDRRETGQVTPYAAVVWDFSRDWSAYASYTDIFKPQNNKTASGDFLDPQTGASYEVGVKGSVLDDRLNVSAAVYKAKQDNLPVAIPNTFAPDGSAAYEPKSGTSTRGFEIEVSGEVQPGWQLSAAFARNMTRDRDGKRLLTQVPQNTLKLATSYRIAGIGHGLTVGGALRWQSEIYSDDMGPAKLRFVQPSYAVADLMLRYAFNPRLAATLNIYNVFDKRYYNTTGNSYWGAPRSARVSLEARF